MDRFHDYERTMQLNYFGSVRLTLGFLSGMRHQRRGHVINISSIGVLSNAPRFSAYVASKAAPGPIRPWYPARIGSGRFLAWDG